MRTFKKGLLWFSLSLNVLLGGFLVWSVQKLGGFGYVWHRIQHREWGVYYHRTQHFARLPERPGAVVFLGDSQIEQAEWHEMFGDTPPVLNRGLSGDYTTGVLERLDEVLRHRPSKIFLLVGINDLFFGKKPEEIEVDYRTIVQRIRSRSADTELYLLSVLPLNNDVRRLGLDNSVVQALNARIREIAHGYALPYIDLYDSLTDAAGRLAAKFTDDGLHINGLGYTVLREDLKQAMSE